MNIKIHDITYIVMLISFLAGYFEYTYLFMLTIIIHECGHLIFGKILALKTKEIIIYPFGGITIYNEDLNLNTNKELFVLLGGITFELLFYFLIIKLYNLNLITTHVYNLIYKINITLISFNFMPILPLDGGKLLNIIMDKILPYKLSHTLAILISIIFIFYFFISKINILRILLTIFLMKNIYLEIKYKKHKYNQFLLERYLNKYEFKHIKKVNNINKLKRDYTHIIEGDFEKNYLSKLFDTND